jgi:hypothetical protein
MLQATADASALAAVIDLPDAATAVLTAQDYAESNLGIDVNGHVLDTNDVHIGLWDPATNSLDTTSAFPDAVMVTVNRSAANANAVPVNFLRIIGLQTWNVTAQAVAQRFIPDCLRDGLIAREMVDMSSNNSFVNRICIHGEQGVNIQSNNFFESGVNVSMPSLAMLEVPRPAAWTAMSACPTRCARATSTRAWSTISTRSSPSSVIRRWTPILKR